MRRSLILILVVLMVSAVLTGPRSDLYAVEKLYRMNRSRFFPSAYSIFFRSVMNQQVRIDISLHF